MKRRGRGTFMFPLWEKNPQGIFPSFKKKKKAEEGAIDMAQQLKKKSIDCSSRGPGFNFRHPPDSSPLSVTLVAGDPKSSH